MSSPATNDWQLTDCGDKDEVGGTLPFISPHCHRHGGAARLAGMTLPWIPVEPLAGDVFAQIRRRAIFDCCKWDPQVGDACSIARHPLVLTRAAWTDVTSLAEALAKETLAAEAELVQRPALHRALGLPCGDGRRPG